MCGLNSGFEGLFLFKMHCNDAVEAVMIRAQVFNKRSTADWYEMPRLSAQKRTG